MKLLLDSHAFLWALAGSPSLGAKVRGALDDADVDVWLSSATVWELGIKVALGRLSVPVPLREMVGSAVTRGGMHVVSVSPEHALRAAELPLHHRDPFDRLLVSQAISEGMTLASRDVALDAYGVPRIW